MQKDEKIHQKIILIVINVLFVLACVGSNLGTPTTTPTQTSTPCLEVPYTPTVEYGKPIFYFILIDGTLNYDVQRIDDVRKVLGLTLSSTLQTGDRVIVGWINDPAQYNGIESTIFYNDVFLVESGDLPLMPTLPPTLGPFSTATITPTSIGQLRQTEIARTVDAVKRQEEDFIQDMINEYFCRKGESVAKIEEIQTLVGGLKRDSIASFVEQLQNQFPSAEEYEFSENNPFFEVLSRTSNFITAECDLNIYSNCVLLIFSDMDDFRQNLSSNKVPYSDMIQKIDVVPILYKCQFATACDGKMKKWSEHFNFFHSRSLGFVLNKDADKEMYNERISAELISQIFVLKLPRE